MQSGLYREPYKTLRTVLLVFFVESKIILIIFVSKLIKTSLLPLFFFELIVDKS
jgi:hypothetical protein